MLISHELVYLELELGAVLLYALDYFVEGAGYHVVLKVHNEVDAQLTWEGLVHRFFGRGEEVLFDLRNRYVKLQPLQRLWLLSIHLADNDAFLRPVEHLLRFWEGLRCSDSYAGRRCLCVCGFGRNLTALTPPAHTYLRVAF